LQLIFRDRRWPTFAAARLPATAASLLLRQTDRRIGLLSRLAASFTDFRSQKRIEHSVEEMLCQRVYVSHSAMKTSTIMTNFGTTRS
jgi:hypothetical protein